jgi:hypothetical protein
MRRSRRPQRRLRVQLHLLDRRRRRLARRIAAAIARLGLASRRALRAGIILGVIGGASLAAGVLASTFYGQFGYHPGRDADAWASRAPAFVGPASCAACHAAEATTWASAAHQGVTCESCHGPLAGHPAASLEPVGSAAPVPLLSLDERSSVGLASSGTVGLCLTCHQAVVGRPSGFPTIDLATHFIGPDCTVCHDPHSAVAPQPPAILHTLDGLPECTVCHSPGGMRPLPAAHPAWSGSCLACHRALRP